MPTKAKPQTVAVDSNTEWKYACDSYGKVRHSKMACVYKGNGSAQYPLVTVAARIKDWSDARAIVRAVNSHAALVSLIKQYRADSIAQGAEPSDLAEIDAALKLAGEEI